MGDDTWLGLFPDSFYKHYFFDSFNTKVRMTYVHSIISLLLDVNSGAALL